MLDIDAAEVCFFKDVASSAAIPALLLGFFQLVNPYLLDLDFSYDIDVISQEDFFCYQWPIFLESVGVYFLVAYGFVDIQDLFI